MDEILLVHNGKILSRALCIMPQECEHLPSRSGKRLHRFFWSIFFAMEKTLSESAVEAGIAGYFLASLAT